MRLVLDTDVLVAGTRSDQGASRRLLSGALDRRFTLLLSVPLVLEYEAVLTRETHLEAAGLTVEEVGTLLDALVSVAEPVRLAFHWRPSLQDPGDEMVLEAAVNGGADLLVTFNTRHLAAAAEKFRLAVVLPREALPRLKDVGR